MITRKLMISAAVLMTMASQGQATEAGAGYFGLSFGHAKVSDYCGGSERTCDDTAITARMYGGMQLNDYAGLELGYRYMDHVEASGYIEGFLVELETNAHFVDASFQLGAPVSGPVDVFAKAGAMYWKLDHRFTINALGASASDEEDGIALRTGIGARYDLNAAISLRADWDYLVDIGDELGDTDIHVFSFGPEVRF